TEALLAEYLVDGLGDPGPVVLGDPHVTDAERGMRRTGRDGLPQPVEPDQGQFDRVTDDAHFSPITGGTDFSSEPNSLFGSSVAWNLRLCSLSSPLPPAAPAPPIMPPIPMPPRMPPMPAPRAAAAAPPAPPGAPPPAKAPLARPPSAAEPLPEPLPKAPAPKPPAPVPEPAKSDGEKLDAEVLPSFGLDGVNELPASSSRARRARSAAPCWRLRAPSPIWRRCSSARRCASSWRLRASSSWRRRSASIWRRCSSARRCASSWRLRASSCACRSFVPGGVYGRSFSFGVFSRSSGGVVVWLPGLPAWPYFSVRLSALDFDVCEYLSYRSRLCCAASWLRCT